MFAIIRKEFNSFFASPIGYLVLGAFLVMNGLFLWVFSGAFNIFDAGFAELRSFFELAPWVFIFLIPAVTMRSFSEELRMGTLELLLTKPLSSVQIILGKYFGALLLILLALVPTFVYIFTIYDLGNPPGNLDLGSTFGGYLGLVFLAMAYTGIGIFTSTLSNNQIVAFLSAVLLCFLFYYGFEGLSTMVQQAGVATLGLEYHFKSISRGVIDTRDVVYFLSIALFFLLLTKIKLEEKR